MSQDRDFCADINGGEPLAGTTPEASAWVIIEAPGAWSRTPLRDGVIGPVGVELETRAAGTGTRLQVARRSDRRAHGSRFWVAATGIVLTSTYFHPRDLLELDLAAIGAGELPDIGEFAQSPLLFICQNGKRDACCARLGRPLVDAMADAFPEQVWETSHLGGHRFAPTALVLPDATVHGRLDEPAARELLVDALAGRTTLAHCRGRASLPRPLQAAELAVRRRFDVTGPGDLSVTAVAGGAQVSHVDGRNWSVEVDVIELAPRPESCGGKDVPGRTFRAGTPQPI